MKEKFFRNIICNFCIVLILGCISILAFNNEVNQVFNANSLQAIYKGNTTKNNVSLMFNIYWGTEYLPDILNTLKKHDVKVTFFIGGMWACENEDLIKQFLEQGHELGNHGYFHKDHTQISLERNEEEIYMTHSLIKSICGINMNLFAPPSGAYNDATLEIANKLGYKTIMWTKDTIDWRDKDSQLIYNRATKNACGGDLILMHPTEHTSLALNDIIEFYLKNDFVLTTVSNTLS